MYKVELLSSSEVGEGGKKIEKTSPQRLLELPRDWPLKPGTAFLIAVVSGLLCLFILSSWHLQACEFAAPLTFVRCPIYVCENCN